MSRNTAKHVTLTVRLTRELRTAFKIKAASEGKTMDTLVNAMIVDYVWPKPPKAEEVNDT
jgi:predicted DNA binding CopG/RHH family protein